MFGFLAQRNIILMLVSVEVMLNAVNLSLIGLGSHFDDLRGQVLALFVIALNWNKPRTGVVEISQLKW